MEIMAENTGKYGNIEMGENGKRREYNNIRPKVAEFTKIREYRNMRGKLEKRGIYNYEPKVEKVQKTWEYRNMKKEKKRKKTKKNEKKKRGNITPLWEDNNGTLEIREDDPSPIFIFIKKNS